MYVGLREVSCCAVTSDCSRDAGKNGYRFGFWSTTPIFAKKRHKAAQNGLGRGVARHQRSGHLQLVLPAHRAELQPEQRPNSACRRAGVVCWFSRFSPPCSSTVFRQKRLWTGAYGVDGDRETRPARASHTPLCPRKVSGPPLLSLPFYFGEV